MNESGPSGEALSLDTLLAHQGFLAALARNLTRDEEQAADLVQEVWLGALEGPAPRGSALRGWLAAILRNAWSNLARREGERGWREARANAAAHSDPAASDPERVLRGLEHRRRVLEAVRALPEPQRTAIYLRYYESLPLAELARRTGVVPETARSRLQRGHELLRARLEREFGSRRAWMAALAIVGSERAPAPTAALPASLVGGLAPLAAVFAGALVAIVALAWGLGILHGPPERGAYPGAGVARAAGRAEFGSESERAEFAPRTSARVPAHTDGGPREVTARPEISVAAAGREASVEGSAADQAPARRSPGARATARRTGGNLIDAVLLPDAAASAPPRPAEPKHVGPPRVLRGRLRTLDGSSPAGWQVAIRNPSRGVMEPSGHVAGEALAGGQPLIRTVDAAGDFRFEGLFQRTYDLIAWDPVSLRHTLLRDLDPDGAEHSVPVGDPGSARRVAGRLGSRSGAPLAGARIRPGLLVSDADLGPEVLGRWALGPEVLTDGEGRFEFAGPIAFPLRLLVEGEAVLLGDGVFDLDGDQDAERIELELPAACELRFEWHGALPPADLLAVLGADGRRMWLRIGADEAAAAGEVRFWRGLELGSGPRSRTFHVNEDARQLVLLGRDGVELERRPIRPDPARPTVLWR